MACATSWQVVAYDTVSLLRRYKMNYHTSDIDEISLACRKVVENGHMLGVAKWGFQ